MDFFVLDKPVSTTSRLSKTKPNIDSSAGDRYKNVIFLPGNPARRAEGGLRVQGYFKNKDGNNPLISIITVVLNDEQNIEITIKSVLEQNYENVEFIIIDGGSTDNTQSIIKKYDRQIDYWVSEPDSGIYEAFNKAVLCCQGDWVCFLGSGDSWINKDSLCRLAKLLDMSVDLICAKMRIVNKNKETIKGRPWKWNEMKKWQTIAHPGMLHNVKLFKKYGLFNQNLQIAGDYEWLLRLGNKVHAIFLDSIVVNMEGGGVSNRMAKTALLENYKIQCAHSEIGIKNAIVNIIIAFIKKAIRQLT